jgi:DNA-binding response OmpR family regulator
VPIDSIGSSASARSGERAAAARVLLVDDDVVVRDMLADYLRGEGLAVVSLGKPDEVSAELSRSPPDVIVLDLVMPGEDGLSVMRAIRRRSDVPIIIMTSRDQLIDRVVGLEAGADDYLCKPAHPRELLARIRTVLRRGRQARPAPEDGEQEEVLRFEGFELYRLQRRLVGPDGREVPLTTSEFDLLLAFVLHPGRPLERERLMDLLRGPGWAANDRSIDQQVSRLRRKIETDQTRPTLIKAIRGVGYLFSSAVTRHLLA